MNAPAFTSGPWLVHATNRLVVQADGAFAELTVKDGKVEGDDLPTTICLLRDPGEALSEDETLANGFLIAAAPELYDACGAVLRAKRIDARGPVVAQLHAALRKARGETA